MGKIVGFSKKDKEDILKQAIAFWEESTRVMTPFFNNVNEYERVATVRLPKELQDAYDTMPERSALVPPDVYNNLNSLKAHFRKLLFAKRPYHRLSLFGQPGVINESTKKAEMVLQAIYDVQNEGAGLPSIAKQVHHQALYAGIAATYYEWKVVKRRQMQRGQDGNPALGESGFQYKDETVMEYPSVNYIDIRRMRLDPSASSPKQNRIVGLQSVNHQYELFDLNRDPDNHYDFKEDDLDRTNFQPTKYFEFMKADTEEHDQGQKENQDFGDKRVERWSIRGLFRFERDRGRYEVKDLTVEVGNREVLLAVKENDLPLSGWQMFDFPAIDEQQGKMFPMGVVEPSLDTFVELFQKRNQSLDSANRNVYVDYYGDAAACETLPEYMDSASDRLHLIDLAAAGLNDWRQAIGILERPQLGQDTFMHASSLSRTLQQTMRMSDYLQGITPDQTESATGVAQLVTGGQDLTQEMIIQLQDTWYAPMARKLLVLWNFFLGGQTQQITKKDGTVVTIEPGDTDIPVDVTIETNIGATQPSMVRRFVEVYPTIANDPAFDPDVSRETLVDILNLPNADRLLVSKEYEQMIVSRESIMLGYGIESPVHPRDRHQLHVEGHLEYIEYIESLPPNHPDRAKLTTDLLIQQIEEHQKYLEMQNNALGNTKAFGGNTGATVQPDMAAVKVKQGNAKTGNYTPRESRK